MVVPEVSLPEASLREVVVRVVVVREVVPMRPVRRQASAAGEIVASRAGVDRAAGVTVHSWDIPASFGTSQRQAWVHRMRLS